MGRVGNGVRNKRGENSLSEGLVVVTEQLEEGIRVRLDVKFHLAFFGDLRSSNSGQSSQFAFGATRSIGTRRTSNPASDIRSSISNLCSNACGLMMATVRVRDEVLEETDPSRAEFPEPGEEGADDIFRSSRASIFQFPQRWGSVGPWARVWRWR